jgi:hypothetical protein
VPEVTNRYTVTYNLFVINHGYKTSKAKFDYLILLPNTPSSFSGLSVCGWVPVRVEDDDPVSAGQIDTKSTHSSGKQKHKMFRVLNKFKLVLVIFEIMS